MIIYIKHITISLVAETLNEVSTLWDSKFEICDNFGDRNDCGNRNLGPWSAGFIFGAPPWSLRLAQTHTEKLSSTPTCRKNAIVLSYTETIARATGETEVRFPLVLCFVNRNANDVDFYRENSTNIASLPKLQKSRTKTFQKTKCDWWLSHKIACSSLCAIELSQCRNDWAYDWNALLHRRMHNIV